MLLEVTQEDIDKGKPLVSDECAVSHAIKRVTGRTWQVQPYVGGGRVDFVDPERGLCKSRVNLTLARWAKEFDAKRRVKPHRFQVPDLD